MTYPPGTPVICDRALSKSEAGTVISTYTDSHRLYVIVNFGGVFEDLLAEDVRPA